jgi:hypothetical protein
MISDMRWERIDIRILTDLKNRAIRHIDGVELLDLAHIIHVALFQWLKIHDEDDAMLLEIERERDIEHQWIKAFYYAYFKASGEEPIKS